ncbi:MAG: J domain-containing protein [Deltaproteobacteria bacterium]|nr:J domain-containing protein [Deltaproteobacteria bacterium]
MKDYYEILEIPRNADEKDMKKAYRQLALKYHPDRNPGNKDAENRFKDISEAYSILIDPKKREQYDLGASFDDPGRNGESGYGREDMLRNFFNNPEQQAFFNELRREFEQQGFRFDEKFLNDLFTRGGGFVFGSVFTRGAGNVRYYSFGRNGFGSRKVNMPRRPSVRTSPQNPASLGGIAENMGRKIGRFLSKWLPAPVPNPAEPKTGTPQDIHYRIALSYREAVRGKDVVIQYPRGDRSEKVAVKVPPGIRSGTKLKLKNMGMTSEDGESSGDLYIRVEIPE